MDSNKQAQLLDKLAAVMGSLLKSSLVKCSAFIVPKLPQQGMPKSEAVVNAVFCEVEEKHPGPWKLFLGSMQGRFSQDLDDFGAMLALTGKVGTGPCKIAMINVSGRALTSPEVKWSSVGIETALAEAGIEIIEDSTGLIVTALENKAVDFGFFAWDSGNWKSHYAMVSEQAASLFKPQQLADNARKFAYNMIVRDCRVWRKDTTLDVFSNAVSLGAFSIPKVSTSTPYGSHRLALEDYCLPPYTSPDLKIAFEAEMIVALAQAWDAYLSGYGVKMTQLPQAETLKELATDEMRELIADICSGDIDTHGKEALDAICKKAMELGRGEHDLGLYLFEPGSASKAWPAKASSGSTFMGIGEIDRGDPKHACVAAHTIDAFIAKLEKPLEELGNNPAVAASVMILDQGSVVRVKSLVSLPVAIGNPTFGVILVDIEDVEPHTAASAAACVHAAGWDEEAEVDALVSIAGDFSALEPEYFEHVLSELDGKNITFLADWKIGKAQHRLEDIAKTASNGTFGGHGGGTFILKGRECAAPTMLEKVAEAGRQALLADVSGQLSRMAGNQMAQVIAGAKALSNGRVELDPDYLGMPVYERSGEEHWLLRAMEPANEFFSREDTGGLVEARDIYGIWIAALDEWGLALSGAFPLGTDPDKFDVVKEMIGIESYLDAYFAGVPVEDIVDPPWLKRNR